MRVCGKCGTSVVDSAKFCGACGAEVDSRTSAPASPANPSVVVTSRDHADPLAATAPANPAEIASFRRQLEASRSAREGKGRKRGGTKPMKAAPRSSKPDSENIPTLKSGVAPEVSRAPRVAPTQPDHLPSAASAVSPTSIGARVQVAWADGRRYPGTVQQAAQGQVLVAFPDGQQRWVDVRHVTLT